MALVSKSIPNLINGISQQPPALRLETQGEVQENGLSDVVDGLKKRPPTQFLKRLVKTNGAWNPSTSSNTSLGNLTYNNTSPLSQSEMDAAFIHSYKRSEDEQYTVVILPSSLYPGGSPIILVYDIAGNLRYESNKSSWLANGNNIAWTDEAGATQYTNSDNTAYLRLASAADFTSTSVADATFIVNKNTTVELSDSRLPPAIGSSALVYLKSVNYGREYKITISSKTPNNTAAPITATASTLEATTNQTSGVSNSNELKVSSTLSDLRSTLLTSSTATGSDGNYSSTQTFDTALTRDHINGELALRTLELNNATYNADQTRLIVTVGDVTVPYNAQGVGGWKYATDHATSKEIILPPEYVSSRVVPPLEGTNSAQPIQEFSRAAVSVYELEAGVDKDITLQPTSYTQEPYFVINSTPGGRIEDFNIIATDDDGGINLRVFKDNAKSFTDLPNQCVDGYKLGVVGDNNKNEDDFHVVFEGTGGSGYWRETVQGGLQNYYDLTTMPHTLRQGADLQFAFAQGEWNERKAGDDNTNPAPSFVGSKINDIFFHRNRLGILSDENVIFSEASSYFNFWRTTVRTLLDSDPIDVAVSQNEVSMLQAAVPIQDNLLLFSELNQFTLSASQLLTPSEISIDQSTKYECDLTATPVGAGNSVFFATRSGDFAGVREFYIDGDSELKNAVSITAHVPQYLEGNIRKMASSSNEDTLVCLTETNKKECYVYKWYDANNERLQSSWSKWTFQAEIVDVSFNNATAFFTFNDGTFQKMQLKESPVKISYTVGSETADVLRVDALLDSRGFLQRPAGVSSYTGGAISSLYVLLDNDTVFTDHRGDIIAKGMTTAELNKVATYLNSSHIENGVTVNNYAYAGKPYTFKYQLSEQVFKPVKGDSTELARFQIRNINFNYNDTATFKVTVENLGRDPVETTFTGRILGQANNILGLSPIVESGGFKIGVQSQAKNTNITITNDTHLPSIFQSVEWEGFVNLRNQRL